MTSEPDSHISSEVTHEFSPEVPEPDFEKTEAAFEDSLGAEFGTASIIEEEAPTLEDELKTERTRARRVFSSMQQTEVRDHRVAGLLACTLGPFGMHKFYLGYHIQGFIVLLTTVFAVSLTQGPGIFIIWIIAVAEALNYFALSQQDFERVYVEGTRNWF